MVSIHIKQSTFDYGFSLRFRINLTSKLERIAICSCWYRERELKLRSSDHEQKQPVVASGIESSIANWMKSCLGIELRRSEVASWDRVTNRNKMRISWLRSCLGIELRRSEVASWDRVTNGNKMRIRFRVRDREFSTVRVYRRGDYGFVG
ncbi:hypothetical protein F2Q70_00021320 [Brassica cretica]|uniref:Uncharacterized protein n=1 Tax=Brassica cretica TaxID=69181 RepID=A0A8S9GSL5_BRACR|nr:hypothetical protein F2Q70_00021320 [Brassica cretica]